MSGLYKILTSNKNNAFYVVSMFLMLLMPSLYFGLFGENVDLRYIVSSIVCTLPCCYFVACIRNKILSYVIICIMMIISFIEVLMVRIYDCFLSAGNILSIINTNTHESMGFIEGTISFLPFTFPVIILFVCALYGAKNNEYKDVIKSNIICSCLAIIISFFFIMFNMFVTWKGEINIVSYVKQNVFKRPPYNIWFQIYQAHIHLKHREYIKESERMSFGAYQTNPQERPKKEIYILGVGESFRYYNLPIAGYKRNTTPYLDSLENIVWYTNYFTAANITYFSVPQIITRATPDDYSLSYKEKSVFKPYQECGFKTFVMTSSNLLEEDAYKHLSNGSDGLIVLKYSEDWKIAETIDSIVSKYDKVFFIVQFAGNHSPYINFDKEHDLYHPNPVSDNVGWDNHEAAVNAYDNTVRQIDHNLFNIVKVIDRPDTQSAFIMTSDHGADYSNSLGDHGRNWNPDKTEYHVPLFIWYNDVWKKNHQHKINALYSNKDVAVNSDNIFYSVVDIADIIIEKQYAKPEWSFLNSSYVTHKRKIMLSDGVTIIELDK